MSTAVAFKCKWCGWIDGSTSPGCPGCFTHRADLERAADPSPRVFHDRNGRELPVDDQGRPMCPRCCEYRFVAVTSLNAHCAYCHEDVSFVEPKKHLPDF